MRRSKRSRFFMPTGSGAKSFQEPSSLTQGRQDIPHLKAHICWHVILRWQGGRATYAGERMKHRSVSLDDKYTLERGEVLIGGLQALVRVPLDQARRDRQAGLKTAGFISGYRGSPLRGYHQQLARARPFLDGHRIHFQPGVNEDLAATAVWGSQQVNLHPGARYDGVFGIWYGKAPGLDRSGDVLKHANFTGTWRYGGVLAVAGDDPLGKSSNFPCQSELAFVDAEIPVLAPADLQDVLDLGLHGLALSRFSGLWVGMIAV